MKVQLTSKKHVHGAGGGGGGGGGGYVRESRFGKIWYEYIKIKKSKNVKDIFFINV